MFSVRLVSADSYQTSPLTPYDVTFSNFRNSTIKSVPTIRIFGSTLSGEKVCLHIHGVFPYIYVPYSGGDNSEDFACRLAKSLDSALNISVGSAGANTQHVYKIQQVKGVPFYGYHEKCHQYFKIYFYNPAIIKRAADLLQNGSVLNQTLQPHEAHIPFILQFMIDYNIYGMSLINLKDVKYRQTSRSRSDSRLNNENLTLHFKTRDYLPPTVKRQSTCEIEVDAWASDIQNKEVIEHGLNVNPGLAAIWDEEKARRILDGLEGGDSQMEASNNTPRSNLQPSENDLLHIQRFQRKLALIFQSEENSASVNSDSSCYPIEVDNELNLFDASYLETHIGPKCNNQIDSSSNRNESNLDLALSFGKSVSLNSEESPNPSFKSMKILEEEFSQNQNRTLDQSIFDTEDVPLVDILEQLAVEHHIDEQVDEDSILGSHCSVLFTEDKSDEEVENGIPDLSLTTFEIDTLSLNCNLTPSSTMSKNVDGKQEMDETHFMIQTLSLEKIDFQRSQDNQTEPSSIVPQFDGANDLSRKRSSSTERDNLKKKRKLENDNKNLTENVVKDISKEFDARKKDASVLQDRFTLSKRTESSGNSCDNVKTDCSLVSEEEKLVCNYKRIIKRNKSELIVNCEDNIDNNKKLFFSEGQEKGLRSSILLQSPKRAFNSHADNLTSPSRASKVLRSPCRNSRKLLQSPRQNYLPLKITVTPIKSKKSYEISDDEKLSESAQLKEIPYFTQEPKTKTISENEVCNKKINRKLILSQKKMITDNSVENVFKDELVNRNLDVKFCEDADNKKQLFLSQNLVLESKISNDASSTNFASSQNSWTKKNSEINESGQLLIQKAQSGNYSEGEFNLDDSPCAKLICTPISKAKQCSESDVCANLFLSQKSEVSEEKFLLSQKMVDEKFVVDAQSSEETNCEIGLTQVPVSGTNYQGKTHSISNRNISETKSSELNLIKAVDNDFPHFENNSNIYDEETDSSSFEENLEVLLKNVSSDSINKDFSSIPGKSRSEDIEAEQHMESEEIIGLKNINSSNLVTTEKINNEVCDGNDFLTVTFTDFTNTQTKPSYNFTRTKGLKSNRLVAMTTKFSSPTRQNIIESLNTYGIPVCRNQEPFYSNPNDIIAQKDRVHQIINKKEIANFPIFRSKVSGIIGIKLWRRMKVNEFCTRMNFISDKSGLSERRLITITPLHLPPDKKKIVQWIKTVKYFKCKEEKKDKGGKKCKMECKAEKINESMKMKECNNEKEDKRRDEVKLDSSSLNSVSKELVHFVKKSRESSASDLSLHSTITSLDLFINKTMLKKKKKLDEVSFGQVDFSMENTRTLNDIANQNLQNAKAITTYQYLTMLCLEIHIATRKNLLPDPKYDRIEAAFYTIYNDVPPSSTTKRLQQGAIIVDLNKSRYLRGLYSCKITYATCEEDLFCIIVSLINDCNPDILIGWELESLSWGYVLQRAGYLGTNLAMSISRIPGSKCSWESHILDLEALAEIKLPGRIVLDVWRIMRHEIALLSYTFENVMYHVMQKRLPCYSFKKLTEWWNSETPCLRWRVFDYYIKKVLGILELLNHLDIIGRTCEHARLFGIQFFEVFSRGSQFRVESMLMRLAKPFNYILVSPSIRQRAAMRAPEALPLIMEPISTFYSDPVVVLDFQSLYPSIIIAYNYCFSTCLGRVELLGQRDPFEFGCTTLKVTKNTALRLQGKINFSPVGIAFVKPEVRKGILPRMLSEILNTRLMVKKSMKDHSKDDRPLQQVLHNRQLGLKLIANVTYGYTAANFSGRMPCIEIGDSIVSKGKETLERAIKLVEGTPKWGAQVVYGDTDSLFILLRGKSRNEAFKIGAEMADTITSANPPPVKLKFEKILHPCILQTKKRYCGYSYETIENDKPKYLAKGIETVRRDGCPAAAKILEKSLKILFDTKDLSQVKQYVTRQLDKVFQGSVSIQDLTFAREFRGLRGYKKNACVPALELTRRLMKKDPRAVPRTSERVPYVIVAGAPNEALIHSVRSPTELLTDRNLRPNVIYYITRVIIPPLNRCLNLLGTDVNIWYRDMSHREVLNKAAYLSSDKQKVTISQFFSVLACLSCESPSENKICKQCMEHPSRTIVLLHQKLKYLEKNVFNVDMICRSCTGQLNIPDCESLDCPITYRRSQIEREYSLVPTICKIIDDWEI